MALGAGTLSPTLPHHMNFTNHTATSAPPRAPTHRELVRAAISVLCHTLQPGYEKELKPHGVRGLKERLEPLIHLRYVWGEGSVTGSTAQLGASCTGIDVSAAAEIERKLFAQVLRDGYVLCRWVFTRPFCYGTSGRTKCWRNANAFLYSIHKAYGTVDTEIDFMDQPI